MQQLYHVCEGRRDRRVVCVSESESERAGERERRREGERERFRREGETLSALLAPAF